MDLNDIMKEIYEELGPEGAELPIQGKDLQKIRDILIKAGVK